MHAGMDKETYDRHYAANKTIGGHHGIEGSPNKQLVDRLPALSPDIIEKLRLRKLTSRRSQRKALEKQGYQNRASTFGYAQTARPGQVKKLPGDMTINQNAQQQPTNTIDNTIQPEPSYDPLTQYNPADLDPTGGAALIPPSNEAANLADPATRSFGVAGAADNMFGTPFQRQRSVSKKYCKKNK